MTDQLDPDERRALREKARKATLDALRALGGEARRDALGEWALTNGGFTPRELTAPPPERGAEKYRRAVDHQLSWTLTNLKGDGFLENPRRGIWKLTSAALPMPATAVEVPVDARRLALLREMPYSDYLKTPEWRRTRAAMLLRVGYACSLDMTHTEDLEVHHRTYEHRGAELVTDLVVLCRSCHRLHHDEYGRPGREPSIASPPRRTRTRARTDSFAFTSIVEPRKRRKSSLLRRLFGGLPGTSP